jgi:predicted O-methyltransferase YrrM
MIEKFFTYTLEIHNNIINYLKQFLRNDNDLLPEILLTEKSEKDALPSIGPEVGKLISLLIRLIKAKQVLEFGTCLGYSTIWLAGAVKATGGKLVSIEYEKKYYELSKKNIARAGLTEYVELIQGDANTIADQLQGSFDLILQDSDKDLYPIMLEKCIKLVRRGGLIIADDALFKPMGVPPDICKPIEEYNKMVFGDPRLYSTILPIGDGIVLSVKL